jgi:hypothetical protein
MAIIKARFPEQAELEHQLLRLTVHHLEGLPIPKITLLGKYLAHQVAKFRVMCQEMLQEITHQVDKLEQRFPTMEHLLGKFLATIHHLEINRLE